MAKKKSLASKIGEVIDKKEKEEERSKNFSEILNSIKGIDSKKKTLWIEIYNNACNDRSKAEMLFVEAWISMSHGQSASISEHVAVGNIMTKYIERLSKSNDQLMDLAVLINKEEEASSQINTDDLFDKINS